MTTMVTELYQALLAAGAGEDKSTAAAKAVADYQSDINTIYKELGTIRSEIGAIRGILGEMRGEFKWIKLALGLILAVQVLPYLKALI